MQFILVGRFHDRYRIHWGTAFGLATVLGIIAAACSALTYFIISGGGISPIAALVGFIGPFLTVGAGIRLAMNKPLDQLPDLEYRH